MAADPVFLCQSQGRFKQARQHLDMFMAIEVSRLHPGIADFLDLRVPLPLDFFDVQAPLGQTKQQALWATLKFSSCVQQSFNSSGRSSGQTVAQIQVNADA